MMESPKPLISVLLSIHNCREFLEQAVDSILNQTYGEFEFILIDDASTDGSSELLDGYQSIDPRVVLLRNDRKIGLAESLNRGIKISAGAYIARMDADDIALPERFEKQLAFLVDEPEIALIGSDAVIMDDGGQEIGISRAFSDPSLLGKIIRFRTVAFHPTWMFRRQVFEKLSGYRDFPVCQDYDFLLRAIESGYLVSNYPGVLLKLRRYSGITTLKSATVRKTTEYILTLRKERLTTGTDSYSREHAYGCSKHHRFVLFIQDLSQRALTQASLKKNAGHKVQACLYYCLSCFISIYQMRLFLRIFRSWLITTTWKH